MAVGGLRLRLVSYNGPRLTQRALDASVAGLNETLDACVGEAKANHRGWRNRTGRAEKSIRVFQHAIPRGTGKADGTWGSFACLYFIYLERRYGTLQGAADVIYPTLGRRVVSNFQRMAVGG
jgi:hypothetical protein